MILRFIKFGWTISLMASLATLLYNYAALPEQVVYSLSDTFVDKGALPRETFFYVSLAFLAGINFLLYTLSKNVTYKQEAINSLLRKWQLSLAVVVNIFFIVVLNFIQLVNSAENVNFNNFGYLIYVALGLIFIWILALPVLLFRAAKLKN